MKKHRKRKKILTVIFLFILSIFYTTNEMKNKDYQIFYQIKEKNEIFEIKEKRTNKKLYYIEITNKNNVYNFNFQFKKSQNRKIIKSVDLVEIKQSKCILPIMVNIKTSTDYICQDSNKIQYDASKNEEISHVLKNKASKEYKYNKYNNKSDEIKYNKDPIIYENNSEYIIVAPTYKGIIKIGKEIEEVELFKEEDDNRKLNGVIGKFYFTADYDQKHRFRYIILLNLKNNKKTRIRLPKEISYDSYVQGINEDSIYIYNKDLQIQYEINTKKKTVSEVGNKEEGIVYFDNQIKTIIGSSEAYKTEIIFKTKIDKIKIEPDLFQYKNNIYSYQQNEENKTITRTSVENKNLKKKLNFYAYNLKLLDEFVYYVINDILYMYSDQTGQQKIFTTKEFIFNKNFYYHVTNIEIGD